MTSRIFYKSSVEQDLKKLDKPTAGRIIKKLERTLATNPDAGERLSGEFRGLWRYRVGDYRVIYTKVPEGVLIIRIRHRREAYH